MATGCREEGKSQRKRFFSTNGEPKGPFRRGMSGTVCTMHEERGCPQTLTLWGMLCELDIPSSTTKSLAAGMANKNHSLTVHSEEVSCAQTVATLTYEHCPTVPSAGWGYIQIWLWYNPLAQRQGMFRQNVTVVCNSFRKIMAHIGGLFGNDSEYEIFTVIKFWIFVLGTGQLKLEQDNFSTCRLFHTAQGRLHVVDVMEKFFQFPGLLFESLWPNRR